jgi:hypothetical protein
MTFGIDIYLLPLFSPISRFNLARFPVNQIDRGSGYATQSPFPLMIGELINLV